MGRIICIDFGKKRIGLAWSDPSHTLALPGPTIEGGLDAVCKVLSQFEIDTIVVGLPLLLNGTKGEMALLAEQFGEALQKRLHVEVVFFDERLSSRQAEVLLQERSLRRKERSAKIDTAAATLLLQAYLDRV